MHHIYIIGMIKAYDKILLYRPDNKTRETDRDSQTERQTESRNSHAEGRMGFVVMQVLKATYMCLLTV